MYWSDAGVCSSQFLNNKGLFGANIPVCFINSYGVSQAKLLFLLNILYAMMHLDCAVIFVVLWLVM